MLAVLLEAILPVLLAVTLYSALLLVTAAEEEPQVARMALLEVLAAEVVATLQLEAQATLQTQAPHKEAQAAMVLVVPVAAAVAALPQLA